MIGGTRILRPLVLALAARGEDVTVVARTQTALDELRREARGEVRALRCDYGDSLGFVALLERELPFAVAVAYMPGAPAASVRAVAASAEQIVHVLPSAFARPGIAGDELEAAAPAARGRTAQLLLGWTQQRRWHTPDQISVAALDLLDSGRPEGVLGLTRPWDDRPT